MAQAIVVPAAKGVYSFTTGFIPDPRARDRKAWWRGILSRAVEDLEEVWDELVDEGHIPEAAWLLEHAESFLDKGTPSLKTARA